MHQGTRTLGDRYELGPLLGQGGMARVYAGTDRTLDRPVAVKVLAEPYDRDTDFVRRFRREALAAARLNHPNIVQVFDSASDGDTHFIVMELVEGSTLSARLEREGPIPTREATAIGADVARALTAAHEGGVIHRDIKPGNVMLKPDGLVKVVDFGIARASGTDTITRKGAVLGSAPYLSPEQAQGAPGEERSDIYALGCVLYHMLTGRPPFVAQDPVAALYQHVNERPTPPSSLAAVPADLERVVLRCLEKEPSRRFGSASELEAALVATATDEPTATLPLVPAADLATTVDLAPGGSTATRPVVGRSTSTHQPTSVPGRPSWGWRWWIGAAAIALLVGGAIALLADPVDLNTRRAVREARRAAQASASASLAPVTDESPSVEEAHDALLGVVDELAAAGDIEDDVASEAREDTTDVMNAFEDGDAEGLRTHLPDFVENLATAADDGAVTPEAHAAIVAAFDDLVLAIENESPGLFDQTPSPPDEGDGDEDDD